MGEYIRNLDYKSLKKYTNGNSEKVKEVIKNATWRDNMNIKMYMNCILCTTRW